MSGCIRDGRISSVASGASYSLGWQHGGNASQAKIGIWDPKKKDRMSIKGSQMASDQSSSYLDKLVGGLYVPMAGPEQRSGMMRERERERDEARDDKVDLSDFLKMKPGQKRLLCRGVFALFIREYQRVLISWIG